ncbi:MAG: glycosyltransferase, partial [Deltaproteobacteria bacterium]|nr:glycosyltransferase [Deltaproteobacteria bacterium]
RGAAAPSQPTPGAEAGHLSLPVRLNRWLLTLSYYRRAIAALRRRRPRIVHCNDYNTMWPGLAAKYLWGAALVYDSHELWPDRNGRSEPRWWLIACESLFVRAADEVLTTSPGHAKAIARRHRIPQPRVVRNLPEPAGPLPAHSANGAGLPGAGEGVFAYAGAVTSGRGLEQAIDALPAAGAARLRILGPGNEGYRSELRARADALGVAERVEFAAPVAPGAVLAEIAGAAAGLALIQPVCRSYELSLPNKLFEYLAAGLPVLASDLPVLGPFVREGGFGISVTPADTAEIAAAMAELANPAGNARFRRGAEATRGGLDWRHERAELADAHRAALGVGG